MSMDEIKAREILSADITNDGSLMNVGWYLSWKVGNKDACLDGDFTADDLEAIAWWMRHAQGKGDSDGNS